MLPGLTSAVLAATPSLTWISTATGTSSVSFAANAGDFLFLAAFSGSGAVPSLPSGWTSLFSGTGYLAAYKVAVGGETSTGSIGSALAVVSVYRGGVLSLGASATNSGTSSSASIPSLTLTGTNGASWVVCAAGDFSAYTASGSPAGLTQRAFIQDAGGSPVAEYTYDTNRGVSSFAGATLPYGGSTAWRTFSVEIKTT